MRGVWDILYIYPEIVLARCNWWIWIWTWGRGRLQTKQDAAALGRSRVEERLVSQAEVCFDPPSDGLSWVCVDQQFKRQRNRKRQSKQRETQNAQLRPPTQNSHFGKVGERETNTRSTLSRFVSLWLTPTTTTTIAKTTTNHHHHHHHYHHSQDWRPIIKECTCLLSKLSF